MKAKKLLTLIFILLVVSSFLLPGIASGQEMNGLIALLTDYGERDFYVAALKGVIYSIYPQAKIVDITHDVEPFNIHEGAVTLLLAARTFPQGTVFVAIVDPGVGTERRAIIVKTNNNLFFVGPDNGLMTLVMQEFGVQEIREITNESWMRLPVSYTFHGRDIFAPAAAYLAQGRPMAEAGPIVTDPIWLPVEPARVEEGKVIGQVLMIDQYGNIQANITKGLLEQIGLSVGDMVNVRVGDVRETSPFLRTYGDVPEGEDLIFIASTDFVEIAINMGNAAEKFGAKIGLPVVIEKSMPGLILTPRILATPTPVALATPTPGVGITRPVVTIISPASGTQVQLGQQVAVQSIAFDPGGVVRSELLINGQPYLSNSSPSPQGQPSFPVTQVWQPPAPGTYQLTVRAYNAAGASGESAPVIIQVLEIVALATPTPATCTSDAAFVADVTTPDYTVLQPGERFDKIWRMRNTGTCPWDVGYSLAFIGGTQMGAPSSQAVPNTPPGGLADIAVPMYAPTSPGVYEGRWRMVDPNNVPFGQVVVVIIQVPAPATPTPPLPPPPPPPTPTQPSGPGGPTIDFRADDYSLDVGECTMLRWDVENVQAVYLRYPDGHEEGVVGHDQKQVCFSSPGIAIYTLHVVHAGGTEDRAVTIEVAGGGPGPGPSGQPDLVVQNVEFLPSSPRPGEDFNITVYISNPGGGDANNFNVRAIRQAPGTSCPGAGTVLFDREVSGLRAGEAHSYGWGARIDNPGNYAICVVLDHMNRVAESNEGNNAMQRSLTVRETGPSGPPNMAVESVNFSPHSPRAGETFQVRISISNRGLADANDFTVRAIRQAPGTSCPGPGTVLFDRNASVARGELRAFTWDAHIDSPGNYAICVVLDHMNRVAESDESDNTSQRGLTVRP